MNKWLYRAVGVASGALLLSSGVAHAESANEAKPTVDPQAMRGLLADLFTPTGGQHHLGLSIDTQRARVSSGILAHSPLDAQPSSNRIGFIAGVLPDLTNSLPNRDGLLGSDQRNELLPGLGLLGGAAGNGGLLGGLTGGAGGAGLVSSLTGGLTGGGGAGGGKGLLGGLPVVGGLASGLPVVGGLTGGSGGLDSLTGGLAGKDGPLGALTGGLTGGGGPLGGLTGGLTGPDGPLGGLTGGLLGGGASDDDDVVDITVDPATLQNLLAASKTGTLGTGGPASTDIVDPQLAGTTLDTSNQRPIQLDPALARQVSDATAPQVQALLHDAIAQKFGDLSEPLDDPTMLGQDEEALPLVGELPLVGPLLGPGGPLGQFLVVGDIFNHLPVVGDLMGGGGLNLGAVDRLPVVGKILNQGVLQTSDGPSLPIVGSLPLVGPALNGLTEPLGGLTGGLTGGLGGAPQAQAPARLPALAPVAVPGQQGQAVKPGQVQQAPGRSGIQRPAAQAPDHVGKHRAPTDTIRPVVVDPEYAESASTESLPLPLIGPLLGGGGMGTLPVTSLVRQLPLVSELPLVNTLSAPLSMLKSLPVVGMLANLVPLESEHVA